MLITQKFNKGQSIVNQGDPASSFYIIKQGSVSALNDGKVMTTLTSGESFGEQALLAENQIRQMTIRAEEDVRCLALGRDIITQLLGNQVQMIIYRNISKWALEGSAIFKKLNRGQIEKLLDKIKLLNLNDKDAICQKD